MENQTEIKRENNIQKAYEFLLEKYKFKEKFTKEMFRTSTGWGKKIFNTYFSKIFKNIVKKVDDKHYLVTETFRKVSSWRKFEAFFSKVQLIPANFSTLWYKSVMIYEFFLPLSNETDLKSALQSLFYKDTVVQRLKMFDIEDIKKFFPMNSKESISEYYERIFGWISKKFSGYSIGHYQGRFKIDELKTYQEVADLQSREIKYLIDETTAIVKFIFPCGEPLKQLKNESYSVFLDKIDTYEDTEDIKEEIRRIRYFFYVLFIDNILQVISGEDEIWMLESGLTHRLHIFKVNRS